MRQFRLAPFPPPVEDDLTVVRPDQGSMIGCNSTIERSLIKCLIRLLSAVNDCYGRDLLRASCSAFIL